MRVIIFGSGGLAKELIGYLDCEVVCVVSTERFNNKKFDIPVVDKAPDIEANYILAVADPALKRKIVAENKDKWISYVHPSCHVSRYATIGKGCILAPQAVIAGDAILKDFVFFNTNATTGHDTVIGAYSTLFPNAEVCGGCDVGEDSLFGIGSYVLPSVSIQPGTKVSAGAIVRKSPESNTTLYGDPAKPKEK